MRTTWVNEEYLTHTKNSINVSYGVINSGVELLKFWGDGGGSSSQSVEGCGL